MRIGFVHSNSQIMSQLKADMIARFPAIDSFHVLNESLIVGLRRSEPRSQVYRRMVEQLILAADAGADLIISTGISLAAAVDLARPVCGPPIINMVDPVAAEAVRIGRRIAILCSHGTASGPSAMIVRREAAAQGREVIIETVVRPEAYTASYAGDLARHDAILTEAAEEVLPRADVLVLAQATLAPLRRSLSRLGKPVLDSPSLLLAEIGRRLASHLPPTDGADLARS